MSSQEEDITQRIEALANSFPMLKGKPGMQPFDALALDAWASQPVSTSERAAAQFILAVWDLEYHWNCGTFDVVDALALWDIEARQAFLSWAYDPWWA